MRHQTIIISIVASVMAISGCEKEPKPVALSTVEMSFAPSSDAAKTKGYCEGTEFSETPYMELHSDSKTATSRTMQISSYLHPQDGVSRNYFTNKTFSASTTDGVWWNTNTVGGAHEPIYWPLGGTLDFLAYSVSDVDNKGISAVWDENDSSSKVVLTVPAENCRNDIMYSGAYAVSNTAGSIPLLFKHAQAWVEFVVMIEEGAPVELENIVIKDAYDSGNLTISQNLGDPTAKWDFSGTTRKDIIVDNSLGVSEITGEPAYLDMLLPQQSKREIVVNVNTVSSEKMQGTIKTDNKNWLMGEKYIYLIKITSSFKLLFQDVIVLPWSTQPEVDVPLEKMILFNGESSLIHWDDSRPEIDVPLEQMILLNEGSSLIHWDDSRPASEIVLEKND